MNGEGGTGFGDRLRACREAARLSQEQLADQAGLSIRAVRNMERGRTLWPYRDSLTRLANALGLRGTARAEFLAAVPRRPLDRGLGPGGPARGGPAPAGGGPGTALTRDHGRVVPRQLPARVRYFTGRAAELRVLDQLLDQVGQDELGTAVISAIGGTAGVGKTALAVHWAHRAAYRFGDGQLYVDLRGFAPSGTPFTATETIRGFLDALGVPPERIPSSPDAQAGLYRSLLSDKRMLIVLDNARDEQQVRPLLPASPGSVVLVTSRNELAGLAAVDGARLITLDALTHAEAVQMLTARLSGIRTDEPDALSDIATLCARLPLALTVAAARAATRPRFPLAAVADELKDTVSRLDALDNADPEASVRTIFSWSYRQLSTGAALMFRLLSLHPGPDISAAAAASLAATDEPRARRMLAELTRGCLLSELVPGRYVFHDLLRAYAAGQARDREGEPGRTAAIGRVLDHYLHTATHAAGLLCPYSWKGPLAPPSPGVEPEQLDSYQQAMAWFEAEYQVLRAAIDQAAESGFNRHAWQLCWVIGSFLSTRGQYRELVGSQRVALAAATRLGDAIAQAASNHRLADAHRGLGDYEQAAGCYLASLGLYQQIGDRLSEAQVHLSLSGLPEGMCRNAGALRSAAHALRLYRAVGYKAGEASALNSVGWYLAILGDYDQARTYCRQALALSAEGTDGRIAGYIWDSLGYIEHLAGNLGEATACYDRALGIVREFGIRYIESVVLTHLGDTRQAERDLPRAREAWQQALAILEDLRHPDVGTVAAKLAS